MACSKKYHEGLKRFPLLWKSLPAKGHMDSGLPGVVLELRNCKRCNSTLAIEVKTIDSANKSE